MIDLRFAPALFGTAVRLDDDDPDVIIIRDHELAEEIRGTMGLAQPNSSIGDGRYAA
jgi:hypothetical protein